MPSSNRRRNDVRTQAIILHRTKYGETDRILNLLTPEGRKSCVAKGVRKEKSKLAGGIEMFTVSEVVIHESEKSDMGILTSAKMTKSYMNIISDLDRFELGSKIIKLSNKVSESVDSPELFNLVNQCFWALDKNLSRALIESYFLFNLSRISGEEVNLHRDTLGDKLDSETIYAWNTYENALMPEPRGNIKADHIKLMRLMLTSPLETVLKVQAKEKLLPEILFIAKSVAKSA
ncbi:DNA repair protein RecO [Candidatus Saccharibacteria bacterium]|nr:DNA repair protein RecO [Candidatus Saccharibacteria bacterium]